MCSIKREGLIVDQEGMIGTRWARLVALFLVLSTSAAAGLWSQTTPTKQQEIHAHFQKAQQAIQSKDIAAAEREFRAVIALDPDNLDARGNLGVMQFFQTDWAGAAEQFRKVLEKQPKQWKVQAYLGICDGHLGHPAEARRLLKVALPHLTVGPFATQAGLELAEISYQSGDLDGAVDVVRILLPSNPNNVDVLYTTARVYADLASRSRDALLLTAPQSARTHQLMAEMLINRGEARAAAAQYRQALEINPNLRGVHFELGEAILQDSRQAPALAAAEKEFRAAIAENSADANAEYRLGTIYSLRRDYQTAIDHYSRALQLQPDNGYAEQGLGAAWMKMGNPEKAREHLLAATRLNPLYPTAHYQLSTVYRQLGLETESRQEMAAFQKLEDSRKRIDQVYMLTRGEFPESNPTGPDTSGK